MFAAEFDHTYVYVKCKLFKQYCCSFYGSPVEHSMAKGVESVCVAWRKAFMWVVHPLTHNDIIATMSEMLPPEIQLNRHFAQFYHTCESHESQLMLTIIISWHPVILSPVAKYIKNVNIVYLIYNQWLLHRNMIVHDVNIIQELIE